MKKVISGTIAGRWSRTASRPLQRCLEGEILLSKTTSRSTTPSINVVATPVTHRLARPWTTQPQFPAGRDPLTEGSAETEAEAGTEKQTGAGVEAEVHPQAPTPWNCWWAPFHTHLPSPHRPFAPVAAAPTSRSRSPQTSTRTSLRLTVHHLTFSRTAPTRTQTKTGTWPLRRCEIGRPGN